MSELTELFKSFEQLSSAERAVILTEQSAVILQKMRLLPFLDTDPVALLAGFVIGSAAADGRINEKEYLIIYPSLVKVFGDGFDFNSVKAMFRNEKEGRKALTDFTAELMQILSAVDESIRYDIIMLCLAIVSVDGKITPREKKYIRTLLVS